MSIALIISFLSFYSIFMLVLISIVLISFSRDYYTKSEIDELVNKLESKLKELKND